MCLSFDIDMGKEEIVWSIISGGSRKLRLFLMFTMATGRFVDSTTYGAKRTKIKAPRWRQALIPPFSDGQFLQNIAPIRRSLSVQFNGFGKSESKMKMVGSL